VEKVVRESRREGREGGREGGRVRFRRYSIDVANGRTELSSLKQLDRVEGEGGKGGERI